MKLIPCFLGIAERKMAYTQGQEFGIYSTLSIGDDEYTIEDTLGHGVFGVVYKVRNLRTRRLYALKDIKVEGTDIEYVQREIETLNTASQHSNVVAIIQAVDRTIGNDRHACILMEYLSGGNLNDRLSKPSSRSKNLKWIYQIADALSFLHSIQIVHRDLKGDNILITDPFEENVKLGDFGLARFVSGGSDGWLQYYATYYMTSDVGPIHSMAPEVFSLRYTEKADVFSLGVVFFAILGRDYILYKEKRRYGAFVWTVHGKVGLGYAMAKFEAASQADYSLLKDVPTATQRMIQETLEFEPRDRPSAREVFDNVESIRSRIQLEPESENTNENSAGGCC